MTIEELVNSAMQLLEQAAKLGCPDEDFVTRIRAAYADLYWARQNHRNSGAS